MTAGSTLRSEGKITRNVAGRGRMADNGATTGVKDAAGDDVQLECRL